MKRFVITLIYVLSLINLYANNNNEKNSEKELEINETQYEKLIDLAKTSSSENIEYAFICLYKANLIAEENNDVRKMVECNTMMADIFKENMSYPTAISYYGRVAEDLIKIKDYHAACKTYINIAQLYQNSEFESKWSIDAMNKAMKYAEETNDEILINEVILAFGKLYSSQNKYDKAIECYDLILKKEISKNTIHLISKTLTNKANVLIKKKEYEKAMNIIDSSLYMCIRDFNDSLLIINYGLKANVYDSINDFESAKRYYKQAIELGYSEGYFDNCSKNMFDLAYLYRKEKKYEDAIDVLKIICDSTEKYKMYEICYESYYYMSHCYASLERYEQAYQSFCKHDYYHNLIVDISQQEKINKLRNSFLLSLNIRELKATEMEENNNINEKNDWRIFISIIVVLMIILITFVVLYINYKTMFNKNKATTYEQELKINKMENDLMEHQLKNSRESLINLALHLKSYMELINPLKEDLKTAIELPENEQKNKIKNIYLNIQNNIQAINHPDNLNKQIDAVYKDFLNRLNETHPNLTKAEKKLCTMLVVNMSSKEIATLTNTTVRSVETSRYRLRKKFDLSRDEDIVNYLKKI